MSWNVLQQKKLEKEQAIQLVSYWATCPICKEKYKERNVRIELQKGGKEFPNRLVGCCSESPTEHIYSFDRVTRIGKPLR